MNCLVALGQDPAPASTPASTIEPKTISVNFSAQLDKDTKKNDRKRFYLIRGNRQQHAELLKQIRGVRLPFIKIPARPTL